MQGILIAIIGVLGVLIPSMLSLGSVHVRRLNRIRQEAEALVALPQELVQERQLARYVLHESMWEYVMARHRLVPVRLFLLAGIGGSLLMGFGVVLWQENGFDGFFESANAPNYRLNGVLFFLLGAGLYLFSFGIPARAVRRRIRGLNGPPLRSRQLIALEASRLDDADLLSVPIGTPAERAIESGPFHWVRKRWVYPALDELDAAARTLKETQASKPSDDRTT